MVQTFKEEINHPYLIKIENKVRMTNKIILLDLILVKLLEEQGQRLQCFHWQMSSKKHKKNSLILIKIFLDKLNKKKHKNSSLLQHKE